MIVERIEEMRLSADDESQIGSLLDRCFENDFGGRSYYQQRHHVRLVCRENGQIIGHMAIALRAIRIGEKIVQVAGLAEVASDPAHRGRGIATTLMKAAISEVRESPAVYFVLFGEQPLYAASGFVQKQNMLRYTSYINVRTGEVVNEAKEGLMVLPMRDEMWDDDAVIDLVGHAF